MMRDKRQWALIPQWFHSFVPIPGRAGIPLLQYSSIPDWGEAPKFDIIGHKTLDEERVNVTGNPRRRRRQKGFTLLELMIVVGIIGILASIAIPNFVKFKRRSVLATAVVNLETVRSVLSQYAADRDDGCYPITASITWDTIEDVLGPYGLSVPANEVGLKWQNGSLSYTRDVTSCSLYTLQITAADNETVFKALPKGVCCDDGAANGSNCQLYMRNSARCVADFGL
jgi:type IV pilus assembly protein PilA